MGDLKYLKLSMIYAKKPFHVNEANEDVYLNSLAFISSFIHDNQSSSVSVVGD